jgi:cytochrome oxidase Cu insertion factor (SCO1/SenC/PrrC family)
LAVGAPIVVLAVVRERGRASGVDAGSIVTPPAVSLRAGQRSAPGFMLRDQRGRAVSVAAYRGRPVIATFIDPLCRNLCPLEAQVLNDALRRMPSPQRPEILAVSVDVYAGANRRANLLQNVDKWHLVPRWRWAVGSPAQLAAVWRRYEVGVKVTTRKIDRTTIHYITHTKAAFVLDSSGHERALFFWPFYPQDVERTLRQLT